MKSRIAPVMVVTLVTVLFLSGCVFGTPKIEITMLPPGPGWITQEEVSGRKVRRSEYTAFLEMRREGAIIPGLMQGLVPQSVVYLPDEDWLLIGGYRDGGSSLVTVVDAETEELVKTVQFKTVNGSIYTGHAGGLAVSEQHMWLASGQNVYFVELDKLIAASDGDTLAFAGQTRIDARGSFVSYSDGILWVGDFALDTRYPTKDHHHLTNRSKKEHLGWVAGYELDPVTDLIPSDRPRTTEGAYIPNYALSIPDKIQESSVVGDKIVLSESYGRNNPSHLYVYSNPLDEPPHTTVTVPGTGHSVPVWFLDDQNLIDQWTLTPMLEGIALRGDETIIIFESAAVKYLDGRYALSRVQIVDTDILLGVD